MGIMGHPMRLLLVLCGVLLIAGCVFVPAPMVPVSLASYPHYIQGTINKEQIKELILEGAKFAGWVTRDLGNKNILATYSIRNHTVTVNINYTEEAYTVIYQSSTLMKMACTYWDNNNGKYRVSGENNCPYNQPPEYIHVNYKVWVDSLVASIERAFETK